MIKFFRHIRQTLIMENKTGKYLKYAIGEIVLVMIGILLALQVNNWNEKRKSYQTEFEILENLLRDLQLTKLELEHDIKHNLHSILKLEMALELIDKKVAYNSNNDSLFGAISSWESPLPTFTAYEIFKNKGIEIIRNKKITEGVINLYESDFNYLINDYDKAEWAIYQDVSNPFKLKYFSYATKDKILYLIPNDYNKLIENPELRNLITMLHSVRNRGLISYELTLKNLTDLSHLIKDEIQKKK